MSKMNCFTDKVNTHTTLQLLYFLECVFAKSSVLKHPKVCYIRLYYFDIDVQEEFVSISFADYVEKQRVGHFLLVLLGSVSQQ